MEILSYTELKKKAGRDISRLIAAENALDEIAAMDHAPNAAFTIFHLLQWKEKALKPNSETSAHTLCKTSNSPELQLLHELKFYFPT